MAMRPPRAVGDLRPGDLVLGPGLRPAEVVRLVEKPQVGKLTVFALEEDGPRLGCADDALVFTDKGYVEAGILKLGDRVRCFFGACGPRTSLHRFWEDGEWGPVAHYLRVVEHSRREMTGTLYAPEIRGSKIYHVGAPGSGAMVFANHVTFQGVPAT